jgi:hypothetical protein
MNASACSENIEQLPKILWRSITGKHNRIHGCQGFLTTIDCFSDMLSMILQKNDGTAMTRINLKSFGIYRRPFKSCNPLRNSTILVDGIQARTCKSTNFSIQNQRNTAKKPKGASRKLTLQLLASRFNNPNKERIALFKVKDLRHQVRHLALK